MISVCEAHHHLARVVLLIAGLLSVHALCTPRSALAQASMIDELGGVADFGVDDMGVVNDAWTDEIDLSEAFPNGLTLDGTTYSSAFIHSDGVISLGAAVLSSSSIRGWYADLDCNPDLAPINRVYWDVREGQLIATWYDVGYFEEDRSATVTFQIVLRDTSADEGATSGEPAPARRRDRCRSCRP
jgi:hypothetical protein